MTLPGLPEWLPLVNNFVVIVGLVISAGIFLLGFKTGQKASKENIEAERRSAEMPIQILMKTVEMEKSRQDRDLKLAQEQANRMMAIAMEQSKREMEMLRKQHAMEMEHQARYYEVMLEKMKSEREPKAS